MNGDTVIYSLSNPVNWVVFYIGKTTSYLPTRLRCHIKESFTGTTKKCKAISEIIQLGLKPNIEIIDVIQTDYDCINQIYANYIEMYWISQFKAWGFELTNVIGNRLVKEINVRSGYSVWRNM